MHSRFCCALLIALTLPGVARAQDARTPLQGRAEVNVRAGTERSILMNEFWVPFTQDPVAGAVLYGDLRLMGDDGDNREFNAGIGYRKIVTGLPVLGDGVAGVHGWVDRRITENGSRFNQVTAGAEWLGETVDVTANVYLPLNKDNTLVDTPGTATDPFLSGTGIFYTAIGSQNVVEEAQKGFDIELGFNATGLIDDFTDSTRVYVGGYHFRGDRSDDVTGWRARIASDITPDLQLGARFQRDDERGSQGFLEATIRLPFGHKKSYRRDNLYARLDQSPERDIDVVTGTASQIVADSIQPVLNAQSGTAQRVIYLDNSGANGTGTLENPFNNLADAQAALQANDILYIATGTGTNLNMNTGLSIAQNNVQVIGQGTAFVFDGTRMTTQGDSSGLSGAQLRAANANPVIGNGNVNGDGMNITARDAFITGLSIENAQRHGIYALSNAGGSLGNLVIDNVIVSGNTQDGVRIEATGAGSSVDAVLRDVVADSNRNGVRFYAQNNASVTGAMTDTITFANTQHGAIVYDDSTAGAVTVDLGGGGRSNGRNSLSGNTLEDLALDIDGATLSAQNNWWGQAAGPDQDNPTIGGRPQIYYGAPINDGLVIHLTFDTEWMSATTAYDRAGNNHNGALTNGLSNTDLVSAQARQGIEYDGVDDKVLIANHPDYETSAFTMLTHFTLLSDPDDGPNNNWRAFMSMGSSSATLSGWDIVLEQNRRLQFDLGDNNAASVRSGGLLVGLNVGTPMYVGYSFDNATKDRSVYVDGTNFQTTNLPAINYVPNTTAPVGVGNGSNVGANINGNGYVHGIYDDVRIYNRALTAGEVAELHRANTSSVVNFTGFLAAAP